ncbi:MAG TPA: penicillin-binding protein activator [Bacteroidales bacterium]|nr:penicillin-binding protein activator [Bacteroidales bacterium]HSA44429.1 penicillin-binding protein activator [Bacteroidales bacterium]
MKLIIRLFLFLLAGSVLLPACRKDHPDEGSGEITIGLLLPLSGAGSSPGLAVQKALEFALEDIADYLAAAGSDLKVNLKLADTQTDTLKAKQVIEEMYHEGVHVFIGPLTSAEVRAVKPFADMHDVLVLSPASVAISLAQEADHVFRLVPDDNTQAVALDAWLAADTVEVLLAIVRDDIWGRELYAATAAHFIQHGGMVLPPVYYGTTETDFTQELQMLDNLAKQAEASYPGKKTGIYLLSFNEGTALLETAAISGNFSHLPWYGSSGFAENASLPGNWQAAAFAAGRGMPCPVFGLDEAAAVKWEPLTERLQLALGRKPEVYALVAYDALWLAVLTYLSTEKFTDIQSYMDIFTRTAANYFGVTGWTSLNEAGDRKYAVYDFWGMRLFLNEFTWRRIGTYDNLTAKLERW